MVSRNATCGAAGSTSCSLVNEPDQALALLDRMYAQSVNLGSEGDIPRLALAKARALVMVGDTVLAELLLASALTTAQSQGAGPMFLRLLVARAALSQASASSEFADAARHLIARMANTIPAGDRREIYVRTAMDPRLVLLDAQHRRRVA